MTGTNKELHIEQTSPDDLNSNNELFQTGFWARLKEKFGWTPLPVKIVYKDTSFTMLILLKDFGFGLHIGYVPLGPGIPEPETGKEDLLINIAREIALTLPYNITFFRFDLPWGRQGKDSFPKPLCLTKNIHKSSADIQPPHTIILRINRPEDEILASMKHKTRYNIRLAGRKGVKVSEYGEEKLNEWYTLYRETAIRDRIALHSFEYYFTLFTMAKDYKKENIFVKLLGAEIENEFVAGIIIAMKGNSAWYLYGASSNKKRNYMPNHALQWEAIRIARNAGCRYYDFFGIPPANNPGHPMHGLFRFKTGFGGDFFHRYGCYDVVLHPLYYRGYTIAEKARTFYFKKLKKKTG